MRVAVLGGGYQGCCTAIELAGRDTQVVLYDRNSFLLAGAATANEGKIHLGYVYGGDRSFATARQMLSGSLPFASMMRRYLESGAPFALSKPYVYAVHRSSLYTVEDMAAYYDAVHELGVTAPDQGGYFGINLEVPPRRLTGAELDGLFDPAHVAAAFETVEVAIDSVALAEKMQARIEQDPRIEVRTERTVEAVGGDDGNLTVRSRGVSGDVDSDRFDAVVNALWDGRLLIDASRGIRPTRKWMHRLKHGIRLRVAELPVLPSVTFALGPFGDLVNYGNGLLHVSWYPSCMTECSTELAPPAWPDAPDDPVRSRMVAETLTAFGAIMPQLRDIQPTDISVKGGDIFAWGASDIDDTDSELHYRDDLGVYSKGNYHSINTGKLTMAPRFAHECAQRILPM